MGLIDPLAQKQKLERRLAEIETEQMAQVIPKEAGRRYPQSESGRSLDEGSVLKLWGYWREIARLAALGYKQQEIVRLTGLSTSTVWNALNRNALVKERIAYLQGKRDESAVAITERLKAMQPVALEVLEQTLLSEDEEITPKLKVDVAKTVLDRGGNGAVTRSENFTAVFTMKDLAEIRDRASQLRGDSPSHRDNENNIEEISYEEVS